MVEADTRSCPAGQIRVRPIGTSYIETVGSPHFSTRGRVMHPITDDIVPGRVQERGIADGHASRRAGVVPVDIREVTDRSPVDPDVGLIVVRGTNNEGGRSTSGLRALRSERGNK
jgi:hypothetical protein